MTLSVALLVPVAALITATVSLVAPDDFPGGGFAVEWSSTPRQFLLVYAVLLVVLLIARTGQLGVALGRLVPVAFFIMVVIAWSDDNIVMNRRELAAVGFGYPRDWLIQDHSWMSPPLPYRLSTYDIHQSPTTVSWGPFAIDFMLTYAVVAAALVIMMIQFWRHRERVATREWESERPEAERFGHQVDRRVGHLLSPYGWHLNLGACSAGPEGFAVLYENDFVDDEIWFTFDPCSGIAEASSPNWWSEPFTAKLEDEAIAYFAREVEAAIEAPDGLRNPDDA